MGAEVVIAFTTIASIILLARLYTRYVLVKNPGHEELAIVFAWVCLRFLLVNSFIYSLSVVSPAYRMNKQLASRAATSNL